MLERAPILRRAAGHLAPPHQAVRHAHVEEVELRRRHRLPLAMPPRCQIEPDQRVHQNLVILPHGPRRHGGIRRHVCEVQLLAIGLSGRLEEAGKVLYRAHQPLSGDLLPQVEPCVGLQCPERFVRGHDARDRADTDSFFPMRKVQLRRDERMEFRLPNPATGHVHTFVAIQLARARPRQQEPDTRVAGHHEMHLIQQRWHLLDFIDHNQPLFRRKLFPDQPGPVRNFGENLGVEEIVIDAFISHSLPDQRRLARLPRSEQQQRIEFQQTPKWCDSNNFPQFHTFPHLSCRFSQLKRNTSAHFAVP